MDEGFFITLPSSICLLSLLFLFRARNNYDTPKIAAECSAKIIVVMMKKIIIAAAAASRRLWLN
jgi:hypothetical protein